MPSLRKDGRPRQWVWLRFLCPVFLLWSTANGAAQDWGELRDRADAAYETGDWAVALAEYEKLVSLFPEEGCLHSRLGGCALWEPGRLNMARRHLGIAMRSNCDEADLEFHRARLAHLEYDFSKARDLYAAYLATGGKKARFREEAEVWEQSCVAVDWNPEEQVSVRVLDRFPAEPDLAFRYYRPQTPGLRLVNIPAALRSKADGKSSPGNMAFHDGDTALVYSSFGKNGKLGKDLFRIALHGGEYGESRRLPDGINTVWDEDDAYLSPDGVLYFSSNRPGGLGGKDIYAVRWANGWPEGDPERLPFPINTVNDDAFFVPEPDGGAWLSSNRAASRGKVHAYRVALSESEFVKGSVTWVEEEMEAEGLRLRVYSGGESVAESAPGGEEGHLSLPQIPSGSGVRVVLENAEGKVVAEAFGEVDETWRLNKRGQGWTFEAQARPDWAMLANLAPTEAGEPERQDEQGEGAVAVWSDWIKDRMPEEAAGAEAFVAENTPQSTIAGDPEEDVSIHFEAPSLEESIVPSSGGPEAWGHLPKSPEAVATWLEENEEDAEAVWATKASTVLTLERDFLDNPDMASAGTLYDLLDDLEMWSPDADRLDAKLLDALDFEEVRSMLDAWTYAVQSATNPALAKVAGEAALAFRREKLAIRELWEAEGTNLKPLMARWSDWKDARRGVKGVDPKAADMALGEGDQLFDDWEGVLLDAPVVWSRKEQKGWRGNWLRRQNEQLARHRALWQEHRESLLLAETAMAVVVREEPVDAPVAPQGSEEAMAAASTAPSDEPQSTDADVGGATTTSGPDNVGGKAEAMSEQTTSALDVAESLASSERSESESSREGVGEDASDVEPGLEEAEKVGQAVSWLDPLNADLQEFAGAQALLGALFGAEFNAAQDEVAARMSEELEWVSMQWAEALASSPRIAKKMEAVADAANGLGVPIVEGPLTAAQLESDWGQPLLELKDAVLAELDVLAKAEVRSWQSEWKQWQRDAKSNEQLIEEESWQALEEGQVALESLDRRIEEAERGAREGDNALRQEWMQTLRLEQAALAHRLMEASLAFRTALEELEESEALAMALAENGKEQNRGSREEQEKPGEQEQGEQEEVGFAEAERSGEASSEITETGDDASAPAVADSAGNQAMDALASGELPPTESSGLGAVETPAVRTADALAAQAEAEGSPSSAPGDATEVSAETGLEHDSPARTESGSPAPDASVAAQTDMEGKGQSGQNVALQTESGPLDSRLTGGAPLFPEWAGSSESERRLLGEVLVQLTREWRELDAARQRRADVGLQPEEKALLDSFDEWQHSVSVERAAESPAQRNRARKDLFFSEREVLEAWSNLLEINPEITPGGVAQFRVTWSDDSTVAMARTSDDASAFPEETSLEPSVAPSLLSEAIVERSNGAAVSSSGQTAVGSADSQADGGLTEALSGNGEAENGDQQPGALAEGQANSGAFGETISNSILDDRVALNPARESEQQRWAQEFGVELPAAEVVGQSRGGASGVRIRPIRREDMEKAILSAVSASTTGASVKAAERYASESGAPRAEGVEYKVQIGAFRNPLPAALFAAFDPMWAVTAASGITRYLAGSFDAYDRAVSARDVIRSMGYEDAFVVRFVDGERVRAPRPPADALALERDELAQSGNTAIGDEPMTLEQEDALPLATAEVGIVLETTLQDDPRPTAIPTTEEEIATWSNIQGRVYSVQVGAFRGVPDAKALEKLGTLTREDAGADGWLRLFSGRFATEAEAREHLAELRGRGLEDAFVVVYINGRRIPLLQAGTTATSGLDVLALPQSSPDGGGETAAGDGPGAVPNAPPGQRKWQVQLGAYSSTIPVRLANAILDAPLAWEIQSVREGGLTRYVTRQTSDRSQAEQWLELAQGMGFLNASVLSEE